MCICVVTDFLPGVHETWGGAEVACARVLRLLRRRGERVVVVTTEPTAKPAQPVVDLRVVPTYRRYLGQHIDFELKNLIPLDALAHREARRLFRKLRPRVVHFQRASQLSLSVVQAAWELHIPVVFSLYDLWTLCPLCSLLTPEGKLCTRYHGTHCVNCLDPLKKPLVLFRKAIFDRMLSKINRFICLSTTVVEQLADYGIPREKLVTLPLPLFDSVELPPSDGFDRSILFTGWVARTKGLHVLVEALPAVIEEFPDVRLNVIETGASQPYKSGLVRRISDLGLAERVHFLGKQPPADVKHLLSRTGMVAVPEQWGIAWPIFLTEAMAYARPIVASRVGDIPQFVRDGQTGYLAERESPEDFAHGILRIFRNEEHAIALGRHAREFILEICDEDRIATQLLSYYAVKETAA